ncbi:hypothetical protein D3C71_175150 [compost metagenome]
MTNARKISPVDPVSAIAVRLQISSGKSFLQENIVAVAEKYGAEAASALAAAVLHDDVAQAARFAELVLGDFRYSVVKNDGSRASISYNGAMTTSQKQAADATDPVVAAIVSVASDELRNRARNWKNNIKEAQAPLADTRTYDPIAASVIRLGMPGGDEFFMENLDFMREVYGDEITDTLKTAVTENDLEAARKFSSLVAEGFSHVVTEKTDDHVEIDYSINGELVGNVKCVSRGSDSIDPEIKAVLYASEGIMTNARVKAKVDAEIAAEEAEALRR